MKKNLSIGALALLAVLAFVSSARATNIIPLKPDSANGAVCTVFGSTYNGMSCGKTTAPTAGTIIDAVGNLLVTGNAAITGTLTYNSAVDGGGTPSLAGGAYIGTAPNISTFTSAGVLRLASVLGSLYGGSGADLHSCAVGAVPYFTSTGVEACLAAGTQNYVLMANGAGAPSFSNAPTILGTNISAIPAANVLAGSLGAGDFAITGALSVSAAFTPQVANKATINALTGAVGRVYSCSDCTNTYTLCTATGTAANQYREVGTATGCR